MRCGARTGGGAAPCSPARTRSGCATTTKVALSWSWRERRAGAVDMPDTFISTICAFAHRREGRPYLKKHK